LSKLTGKLYAAITADKLAAHMVKILLEGHNDHLIESDVLLKM